MPPPCRMRGSERGEVRAKQQNAHLKIPHPLRLSKGAVGKVGAGMSPWRDVVPISPFCLCGRQTQRTPASQPASQPLTHRAQMPDICPLLSADASPTRTTGSPKPAAKAMPPAKSAAGRGRAPPAPGAGRGEGRLTFAEPGCLPLGSPCPSLASFLWPPRDEDWFSSVPTRASARFCLQEL